MTLAKKWRIVVGVMALKPTGNDESRVWLTN
jgi:hypothetical protein